jgi:hypothetical protein
LSSIGDDSQAIGDELEATIFGDYFKKYLKEGVLVGIYLKDDRFGNFDDIVFELNNNILHCIQAKGSKSYEEMTIWKLFEIKKNKKFSLFQKLYNSYKNLKTTFKKYSFKLELITNQFPSSSTSKLPKEGNKSIRFSSFIREIWRPYKSNQIEREEILKDKINQEFINLFSDHLKISEDKLWEFFKDFDFKFDYKPRRARNDEEFKKIEAFYNWYLINKKNPERKGFFSINMLLKEFGLSISPNPHDFPIEREKYIPFPNLKDEIIKEISNLTKGYLFLQGGPSTGKSTFLESEINKKTIQNCIVFKYLCFRESNELCFRSRGELVHFFEDLNEQFKVYVKGISIDDIKKRFKDNLEKLAEIAEEKDKKLLIIIDGIDHVTREEIAKLRQPLTIFLPKPSALPKNIIFLIGGQHFKSIPWYESFKSSKECKLFKIPSFTDKEIKSYLRQHYNYENTMDFKILDKLLNKTQGNPRYLTLICNNFETYDDLCRNYQTIDEYLDFDSDWNDLYEKYWISFGFERDNTYKEIAGLISRIHGPIDLIWLQTWSEHSYIEQFISNFKFCFKVYSNIILFEHNSFKTFLQKKSVKFAEVLIDDDKEKKLYSELARRCNENSNSYVYWNKIIYLKKAAEIKNFKYNRDYFLSQWFQGRNLEDLIEDIRVLLEFYMKIDEIEKSFELIFLKLEFELREALNKLYTDYLNYIFLLNPDLINNKPHLLYLCASILHSIEISALFKINFLLYLIDRGILKEDSAIYKLIKEYFAFNRQNWIEVSYNPESDKTFTKKWLKVAYFFRKDSNAIILDYNRFLLTNFEDYLMQAERWRYYPILKAMGEYLIENHLMKSLEIIYKILNNLIVEDKWELIDKKEQIFRNIYHNELYGAGYERNPFDILLHLKFDESKFSRRQYFEEFLKDNETCKILFENSVLRSIFKARYDADLSEEEIIFFMDEKLTIDLSYGNLEVRIKNRFYLYQYLYDNFDYDSEKIFNLFKGRNRTIRIYKNLVRNGIKMQWEYVFFNIAINLNVPYENINQAKPLLDSIINLFDMFGNSSKFFDEERIRIFANLSLILNILIEKIKDYPFLHDWIQQTVFEYFKQKRYMFNNIQDQLDLISSFQIHFTEVNVDMIKWVIDNAKEHYTISNVGYFSLSSTIYSILRALEILKRNDLKYYRKNRKYFIDELKIFGFRIYPRKDFQLYILIHLLENIIQYFPQDDSIFIDEIKKIHEMLHIADEITESSGIISVRKEFYDIALKWNKDLKKEMFLPFRIRSYIPFEYNDNKRREEIKIDKIFIDDLANIIKNPQKFFSKIRDFLDKIRKKESTFDVPEQIEYFVDISQILNKLNGLETVSFKNWKIIFEYLINQREDENIFKIVNSSFIHAFIDFYREKVKNKKLDDIKIKQLELKIEKTSLRIRHPIDTSLIKLYELDKQECFDYGWEFLNNLFIINRKKILHYIFRDFIVYTFLSKINESNFRFFWNIYFGYLQKLFNLMDYL